MQMNVEDTRLGVAEYVIDRHGLETIELKWGQGAKCIGGEIKVKSLDRALELQRRGYIVTPDPSDPISQAAYKDGSLEEFERHSRLGFIGEEEFYVEVAMGTPLSSIIYDIGGGAQDGSAIKAVQTGDPSGGCLPVDRFDLPVDFEALGAAGSMVGSGGAQRSRNRPATKFSLFWPIRC